MLWEHALLHYEFGHRDTSDDDDELAALFEQNKPGIEEVEEPALQNQQMKAAEQEVFDNAQQESGIGLEPVETAEDDMLAMMGRNSAYSEVSGLAPAA